MREERNYMCRKRETTGVGKRISHDDTEGETEERSQRKTT